MFGPLFVASSHHHLIFWETTSPPTVHHHRALLFSLFAVYPPASNVLTLLLGLQGFPDLLKRVRIISNACRQQHSGFHGFFAIVDRSVKSLWGPWKTILNSAVCSFAESLIRNKYLLSHAWVRNYLDTLVASKYMNTQALPGSWNRKAQTMFEYAGFIKWI